MSKFFDIKSKKFVLPNLPYDFGFLEGVSEQTDRYHHNTHFKNYIDGLNSVEKQLEETRKTGDFSNIRNVMLSFSHNASGAYLHNLFFNILGGDGKMSSDLAVTQKIIEDFGSLERWKNEFVSIAKISRGWVILGLFKEDGKLRHNLVDLHDLHVSFGMSPILAIDVWEHAYYFDSGPDREMYINSFIGNINWKKVNEVYLRA